MSKAEFHIGARVRCITDGPLFNKEFTVDSISPSPKEDGTFIYSGAEVKCFFGEGELDYAIEGPLPEEARRSKHLLRLEQIHHAVGVLLEEGRCIGVTYWTDEKAGQYRALIEDVDLLHRVFITSSCLR